MPTKGSSSGSGSGNKSGAGGKSTSGGMSVREAGQKGGQRVRELIEEGKSASKNTSGRTGKR